ncbi:MAG: four-carbon acid sugar kinase family protein [Clostridia bacterium]|nr:four-carbon acid sugar kinase family protein [Clostridia bacterium]
MKVIIIADDFTGALDTATQFSKIGIRTVVYPSTQGKLPDIDSNVPVVVLNSESRHLKPVDAYSNVYALTQWALTQRPSIIYKKTDSALRGNIGSELQAVSDANIKGKSIYFLPGYPQNARTTVNGIHYYEGIPIAESVFGQDPLDPIAYSDVQMILKAQTDMESRILKRGEPLPAERGNPCIYICDSQVSEDIQHICRQLPPASSDAPLLLAGCAGFAEYVAKNLLLQASANAMGPYQHPAPTKLLVVSGSLNSITMEQLSYSKSCGITSFLLHEDVELSSDYTQTAACRQFVAQIRDVLDKNNVVILETAGVDYVNESIPKEKYADISQAIATLIEYTVADMENYALAVFGGDTLQAIANRLFPFGIIPQEEIELGVPVAYAIDRTHQSNIIITKSGGFGSQDVILKIMRYLHIDVQQNESTKHPIKSSQISVGAQSSCSAQADVIFEHGV